MGKMGMWFYSVMVITIFDWSSGFPASGSGAESSGSGAHSGTACTYATPPTSGIAGTYASPTEPTKRRRRSLAYVKRDIDGVMESIDGAMESIDAISGAVVDMSETVVDKLNKLISPNTEEPTTDGSPGRRRRSWDYVKQLMNPTDDSTETDEDDREDEDDDEDDEDD